MSHITHHVLHVNDVKNVRKVRISNGQHEFSYNNKEIYPENLCDWGSKEHILLKIIPDVNTQFACYQMTWHFRYSLSFL